MEGLTLTNHSIRVPDHIASVIIDPSAYADDRIYGAYRWLRANNPVGLIDIPEFDRFWIVTRYDDIKAIGQDDATFHNADRAYQLYDKKSLAEILRARGEPRRFSSMVGMDQPDHSKYRSLVQAWFNPPQLLTREEAVRRVARKTVDSFVKFGGRCDFVTDIANTYPLHVFMRILGVPEADDPIMLALTQKHFGGQDPDLSGEGEALSAERYAIHVNKTIAGFTEYFKGVAEDRRKNPGDDLASLIANAEIDGAPMPFKEQMGFYILLATGGHDTTASSTATAIWELAKNPAELAKIKSEPSLIRKLIDEAMRFATPVKHFMRSATCDTTVGGRKIDKGDWLMLCYGSANRDEDVFQNADLFQLDRTPNRHLALGWGPHMCLGQHLAKMEMRILFEELLPRIKSLSLDGEPSRSQDWFVNGPKSLPIKFELV